MEEYRTTLWNNIKGRVQYLKKHECLIGDGAELGMAICEELDRIYARIEKLEKKSRKSTNQSV